jgi:hypothetical protein
MDDELRQIEISIYNDFGFVCDGYCVKETFASYLDWRNATDFELRVWNNKIDSPSFPILNFPDDIDLTDCDMFKQLIPEFEPNALEGQFIWIENKYALVLCHKKDTSFSNRGWTKEWKQSFIKFKEYRYAKSS